MRCTRLVLALLALFGLIGCPAPAERPEAPAPTAPAPAEATATATSSFAWDPRPGEVCVYALQDVLTETLGDQLSAGHEVKVRYSLQAEPRPGGGVRYLARIEHVHLTGKREDYAVDLDAQDPADMVRVRGGADTLLLTDAVEYFAMLDRPVSVEVDAEGRVQSVEGGEKIRAAMQALFPPKPRADPHYQGQVKVRLSDAALVERLLPFAALVPKDGLQPEKTMPAQQEIQRPEYAARALTAARLRVDASGHLLLERKRAFAPTEAESEVPPRTGLPEIRLQAGQERTTVELAPGDPCFVRAAQQTSVTRTWRGQIEDAEVTTTQKRTVTRVYERG